METLNKGNSFLRVEGLYKKFGELEVLKGIDFQVQKGEVVAILGSSGSGKTTLLRCLNFLETPQLGKIFVNDELLYDAEQKRGNDEEFRKKRLHFGLVFQSFNLFPQYTVKKNIEIAVSLQAKELVKNMAKQFKAEIKALPKDEKKAKSLSVKAQIKALEQEQKARVASVGEQMLTKVGLLDKSKAYPCELSGGQQQRVAIARALALSPDILCFDEPTSALDPELTGEVLKVIKGLKSDDTTMIIVTHEMEFAKNVADKIIFMSGGVIAEIASPKEFFDNPTTDAAKAFLSKSFEKI